MSLRHRRSYKVHPAFAAAIDACGIQVRKRRVWPPLLALEVRRTLNSARWVAPTPLQICRLRQFADSIGYTGELLIAMDEEGAA